MRVALAEPPATAPPTRRPRAGWKRHGLIDLDESPAPGVDRVTGKAR
jgi:hypothetical protein